MNQWSEEHLYADGDTFFKSLLEAISKAERSVDLQTYIFSNDPFGVRVLAALTAAANRGVRVRLLMDGVGSLPWTEPEIDKLRCANFSIRFFHPLPWQVSRGNFFSSFIFNRLIIRFFELNRRNHRKSCVVDGVTAFLGGMNICSKHLVEFHGAQAWRDTSVRVQGPSTSDLTKLFDEVWHATRLSSLKVGRQMRRRLQEDLTQRIRNADQRVWLMTPYFSPSFGLLQSLKAAAKNGVDVRLLIPQINDVVFMKSLAQAYYWVLLRKGVKIFEYVPSILHGKVSLVDQWLTVGSSNLNYRSLFHDLELDITLSKESSIQSIEKQFELDFSQSFLVSVEVFKNRSYLVRVLETLAFFFRELS